MDISPVLNQITNVFWYLIPILIITTVIKTSWFKGLMGEFIVNLSAQILLDKNEYKLVKNVTLPTEDGTTQIDHVIVSRFGVFVIETKNMKGWIFGNPKQKTWTQKIYRHSSKFQNPLHQNYKHVKTLQSLLGLNDDQLHSLIVFVGDSTFKTEMPANVTRGGEYARYIKSKTDPVICESEVSAILEKIQSGRLEPSLKTNREHIKHVQSIVANKAERHGRPVKAGKKRHSARRKQETDTPACKRCGGPMVVRELKSGANEGNRFWGCANFRECRGMMSYNEEKEQSDA